MAGAYAALLSLQNTITLEQHPRYHPHRHISLGDEGFIEAIQVCVKDFMQLLEIGQKLEHFEDRIAEAAYAAEDAIESYVVDQVQPTGDDSAGESGSAKLCQDLRKFIAEMTSIGEEVLPILEQSLQIKADAEANSTLDVVSSTCAPPHGKKAAIVGFEDEKKKAVEQLTRGNLSRATLPIVGMGGSGKTTLARNIYENQEIMEHFDFLAWVTVSQEYDLRKIFLGVLQERVYEEMSRKESCETIGEQVYKKLFGRRYLIVLDDIWSTHAWNHIQRFFPDDHNGSRIMLTTRSFHFAIDVSTSFIRMNCLDEEKSWNLLCEKVFGVDISCPPELEDVGKQISQNCNGLPLSIVVIGGLLSRSKDRIQWEHIAELSSSAIHLDEEQHCLKILLLSYNYLPAFLKPCFLYMGVFPEDRVISVSELINLWIAEGLVKPFEGKSLEEIAETHVEYLFATNLITIHFWSSNQKNKTM